MSEASGVIADVSDTAFWVAHHRGAEGARSDAMFRDPLATVLAGERGKAIAEAMPAAAFTAWLVSVRTVLIDNFIEQALAEGVDTVLNLGAGLDTRPYRMDLPPGLDWIEVDYPDVIALKETRLAGETPRCALRRVRLDLADLPKRRELFAEIDGKAQKLLVLTEGVAPYLSTDDVGALADDLKALRHIAYWIVDYHSPAALKQRSRRMDRYMRNAPFKFAPDDWFAFFASHGWECKEMRYLVEEAERLKRRMPLSLMMFFMWAMRSLRSTPEQRAGFRKMAGFALLAPRRAGLSLSRATRHANASC
jgi:methyltransferase (TIGR00027 family)